MAIDPGIVFQLQQPQRTSPINRMAQVMQIQGMKDQAEARRMAMDKQNRLTSVLQGQYAKPEDREEALLRGGFVDQANSLTKNRVDAAKVQADTDKNRIDAAHKRVDAWGSAMGYVRQNPTAENAVAAVQHLVTLGVMPQEMAQGALAQVQSNPTPENIARFADMGFRAALTAKDQLPKLDVQNIGGQTITQSVDAVSGKPTITGAVQNTQSPDAVLQAQTSEANNRRSVGAQYANAAATRDIANATKEAALIGANLKNEELRGKLEDRNRQKDAGVASLGAQIGVIDKALTHPGRKTSTGFSSIADPRNFIPGTDASDFRAVLDQIGGTAFLQAFESLKGGGQITEVEGKKATDAIARLSRAQSDSEFERSLRDLREVMSAGYRRAAGKEFGGAAPGVAPQPQAAARVSNDAEYNALPSGAVFVGPDGKQRRKP